MNTALLVVLLSLGTLTLTAFAFGAATLAMMDFMARLGRPFTLSSATAAVTGSALDQSGYRMRPDVRLDERRAA